MKKLMTMILAVMVVAILVASLVGCMSVSPEDGYTRLREAYENTRDNYSDIYQYSEKIYDRATPEQAGGIMNTVVNVNCAVDRDYNLIKDKDYAINVYQHRYVETMDETMKATNKFVGSNDIRVGESKDGTKTLALTTRTLSTENGKEKWIDKEYHQEGVDAKTFYDEAYLTRMHLMNTRAMTELGMLGEADMDYDIPKGGIAQKGRTCDYTFKVNEDYLTRYREEHGIESIFRGKYVWVQTSYGRISNIYVYREETLGGGLTADYESYVFMITYLGKHIDIPNVDESKASDVYVGGEFVEGVLSPLEIIAG